MPRNKLLIRGTAYQGRLVTVRVSLQAAVGDSADVDATAFVPELSPGEIWSLPNFIGMEGFLNRIRFAVDPEENAFYFGQL